MPEIEIVSELTCDVPTPVRIPVGGAKLPGGALQIREVGGAGPAPAQRDGNAVAAILSGFAPGKKRRFRLQAAPGGTAPGVTLKEQGSGLLGIMLPDGPFATYHYDSSVPRPFFYPVAGPGGKHMTRNYPFQDLPEEKQAKDQDHPHHQSFWTAYDDVNGVNNWSIQPNHGFTRHKAFEARFEGPVFGGFTANATWTSPDGKPILDETRTIRVYNMGPDRRLLDYDVLLHATYEDVHYGDTKEGGLIAFRVFHTMKEAEGGRMENSDHSAGEKACWGKAAAWLDYAGPIGGETLGLGLMDHPGNPNHPCRWHTRAYGLIGSNPFAGQKAFGNGPAGGCHQKKGDTLRFRYRVLMHRGGTASSRIDDYYHAWIQAPSGRIVG